MTRDGMSQVPIPDPRSQIPDRRCWACKQARKQQRERERAARTSSNQQQQQQQPQAAARGISRCAADAKWAPCRAEQCRLLDLARLDTTCTHAMQVCNNERQSTASSRQGEQGGWLHWWRRCLHWRPDETNDCELNVAVDWTGLDWVGIDSTRPVGKRRYRQGWFLDCCL